jgi:hypothetical protein
MYLKKVLVDALMVKLRRLAVIIGYVLKGQSNLPFCFALGL